jgi:hypothetical protein
MAANITPIFVLAGNIKPARIAAANTAADGSGTLVTLITAGASGSRVDGVRFRNTASICNKYRCKCAQNIFSDTAGTNDRLIGEVATATATRSATAVGATSIFTFDQPIIMLSGQIMSVNQCNYAGTQDQFDACPFAGDY